MALIIRGKTICRLCNKILQKEDKIVAFPALLAADHQYSEFSDAAFHLSCFQKDPRSVEIESSFSQLKKNLKTK